MPLRFSEPPPTAGEVARSSLERLAVDGRLNLTTVFGKRVEELQLGQGYPLYNLGADTVLERRPLAVAVLTGWQFPLREGDGSIIALEELASDRETGQLELYGVHAVSPLTSPLTDLGAYAASIDMPDAETDWTLRILRIPGLYVRALWFHDEQDAITHPGDADRLSVITPRPRSRRGRRALTWQELLDRLNRVARRRLAEIRPPQQ